MTKPYQGHIENWHLVAFGESIVVIGLQKHVTRKEAHFIRTSEVKVLTPAMVETKNSIYSLGAMDPGASRHD